MCWGAEVCGKFSAKSVLLYSIHNVTLFISDGVCNNFLRLSSYVKELSDQARERGNLERFHCLAIRDYKPACFFLLDFSVALPLQVFDPIVRS